MPRPSFKKRSASAGNTTVGAVFEDDKIFVGSVRKSQLITTFSFGAMVDFVDDTVVIASPDDWQTASDFEERKLFNENLSIITGKKFFVSPKTSSTANRFSKPKNIASYIFPEKQICSSPKSCLQRQSSSFEVCDDLQQRTHGGFSVQLVGA